MCLYSSGWVKMEEGGLLIHPPDRLGAAVENPTKED
jgi:hypothetical protein